MTCTHPGASHDFDNCVECKFPESDHKFRSVSPPIEYLPFILAERFPGTTPDHYMDITADRRALIVSIMNVEGGINKTWAEAMDGTEPGTDIWIAEWEYELWDDD